MNANPVDLFNNWLASGPKGSAYVYFEGPALVAYYPYPDKPLVARLAWDAYRKGLVELVQKRIGSSFQYIAQKRFTRRQRSQ